MSKRKVFAYSAVLTLVAITGTVASACGRRHSTCYQPVYCQPVCVVVSDMGTGTTGSTGGTTGSTGGTTGTTGGDKQLTDADAAKIKAVLKELKISDADADEFVKSLKLAKHQLGADFILEKLQNPDLKKLDEAGIKGILKTFIDELNKGPDGMGRLPAPARLIVRLPENARLLIDGEPTRQTSSERTFESPPLNQGRTYHYTLTAEVMVDGVKEVVSKEIVVAAGRNTETTIEFATTAVAKK